MKTFIIILFALSLLSCSSDNDSSDNCDCNAIIEKTFTGVDDLGPVYGIRNNYHVKIQNVCDASKISEFDFSEIPTEPILGEIGDCYID